MKKITIILTLIVTVFIFGACNGTDEKSEQKDNENKEEKIGVLIISHGSHSETWRNQLLDVGETVKAEILKNPKISDVKSAFMEYTGPNIADQLKAFDEEEYTKVILVPLFLTVSSHTADDIQNIVGVKSNPEVLAQLEEEGIEVYSPKAKVIITPLLDFPGYLKNNVLRRYNEVSQNKGNEGIVLVAYGSEPYEQQWKELIVDIGKYMKQNAEVENVSYAWCGHLVNYSSEPTTKAINQILELEKHVTVIPILVAHDENFQGGIIQKGVEAVKGYEEKVTYRQDAILPDADINKWIIDIANETVEK